MSRWNPSAPIVLAVLTASCAASPRMLTAAPQIVMPAEAKRPCSLHLLPEKPTVADLEIGYVTRGAQVVACDAARRLAVDTHEAEHMLERSPAKR